MKNNGIEKIDNLLKSIGREDLICDYLYKRDYNEIKSILEMKEWGDEKFQGLLTSTIWHSNIRNIKEILMLEEWNDEKFSKFINVKYME